MRFPAKLVPVALLAPLLAGCGGDPEPVTLEVTVQDWSGWQREQPDASTRTVSVAEDEDFTVATVVGEVTVTVVEIGDDGLALETSERLAPETAGGGIGLRDPRTRFTLPRGGTVGFSTPTLDAGTTVSVAER